MHANQILDPIFHQVLDPCLNTPENFGSFSVVEMMRHRYKESKPIYVRQAILDISKTLLYKFHYDYIIPKYGDWQLLMYNDTDSVIYRIETVDVYTDMALNIDLWFDTSNYSIDRPLPYQCKSVIPGKIKDELGGDIITRVICLRLKSYGVESLSTCIRKSKVVQHYVGASTSHEEYKRVLLQGERIYRDQLSFRSMGHVMTLRSQNKLALSREDNKRVICPDYVHTLAKEHY